MSLPEIVSLEEWTRARVAFLEREKALTKARDELAAERRRLPMVEVTRITASPLPTTAPARCWTSSRAAAS